jgi:outer membrane protein assembly factor BamD (BamD/ComL family)
MRHTVLPLTLLLLLMLPSAASAKRLALVIGIDQYANLSPDQQLKKAINDSHAVGESLRLLGYDVQEADNVARLDFVRQWQRFLNNIEPGDEAALFFAGHGVEIGGLNFLLPADVPRVASGEEEVLKASGLSFSDLLEQAREKKPQMMLYVIDACRDNPFANSKGRSIGGTRGLTPVEPPSGTFVMFSAGAGQTALDRLSDNDPDPNSVYTRTLLPRLKSPGKIGDIARDIRRDVRTLALRVNHVQTPAFYDEVIGDFCPTSCMAEAKTDATAAAKPVTPDPAGEAWSAIKGAENLDMLGALVAKYPESFYAVLAKTRIEELKRQQELAASAPSKPMPQGPDPALEAWSAAKSTESLEALQEFIGKYPLSFYATLAKTRIEELKRQQLLAVAVPEKPQVQGPDPALGAWTAAKETESVEALQEFIGKYPLTFYATLAKARIDELKRRQLLAAVTPSERTVGGSDPAIAAWDATKSSEIVSVLEAFVDKYPASFYAELAKARIGELRRKEQLASAAPTEPVKPTPPRDPALEAWNAIKSTESASVIEAFLVKYPDSFYSTVAKATLDELEAKQDEAQRSAMVRQVQKALKDLDCLSGSIDGEWGRTSKEALEKFGKLARLDPAPQEPVQATIELLNGWKGERCTFERVTLPPAERAAPKARERPPAKAERSPPRAPAKRQAAAPKSAKPKADKNKDDFRVYCQNAQGCPADIQLGISK